MISLASILTRHTHIYLYIYITYCVIFIRLQSEIAVLKEENSRLKSDNRELTELNNTAEVLLRERMDIENAQNRQLRNVQADFNALKSQYERITEEQRDLEALAADEQVFILYSLKLPRHNSY